jgi:hypothetical protein
MEIYDLTGKIILLRKLNEMQETQIYIQPKSGKKEWTKLEV